MTPASKNTIEELISEDIERSKPKEKMVKDLPRDFYAKSKYGKNIGPSIGDLNDELKNKMVNLDLQGMNNGTSENPYKSIMALNQLSPSDLIDLDLRNKIELTNDQIRLLEAAKESGICLNNGQTKPIKDMLLKELPQWVRSTLPESINLKEVIKK